MPCDGIAAVVNPRRPGAARCAQWECACDFLGRLARDRGHLTTNSKLIANVIQEFKND